MPVDVSGCSPPAELSEELGERSVAGLGSADSDMGILGSREPHHQMASHQGSQVLIQPQGVKQYFYESRIGPKVIAAG